MIEKKYAEAQAIYADLLAKYPQAYQIELPIARAYHAEGAYDKEIEHLKKYIEKDPTNVEVKLLTGAEMIQKGNADEGKALLASVDDSVVKDPMVFVNVGINLMNQNKAKDAMPFFEKAIARFPESPDAYFYRGMANVQLGTTHSARQPGRRRQAAGCRQGRPDQVPPDGAQRAGSGGGAEDARGAQVGDEGIRGRGQWSAAASDPSPALVRPTPVRLPAVTVRASSALPSPARRAGRRAPPPAGSTRWPGSGPRATLRPRPIPAPTLRIRSLRTKRTSYVFARL